jgi:D-amino-acid oxidase
MLDEIKSNPLLEDLNIEMDKGYSSLEEMVEDAKILGCDSVVNCTGLGAGAICNDSNLFGGRGALLHYDRSCLRREYSGHDLKHDACILTEEGDWGTSVEPCYMIPRGDILVVGGSYKEQSHKQTIENDERKRLEKNAWTLGVDTDKVESTNEWVGWRPCRSVVRAEVENSIDTANIKVVHSYGVGGSGWTVFSGLAKEAVRLLLDNGSK